MSVASRPVRTALLGILAMTSLMVVAGVSPAHARPAIHSADLPVDPEAKGQLTLCSPDGHAVSGGLLGTAPFVWKAVSSTAAPQGFSGNGQNADLLIFQERPGVEPYDWSGDQLTASTRYSNAAHPVAQATEKDIALSVITKEYPPLGPGYYELRMSYGLLNKGTTTTPYAAATIQVIGNAWHVVSAGTQGCNASIGRSSEVYAGVAPSAPAPSYAAEVAAAETQALHASPSTDAGQPTGSSTASQTGSPAAGSSTSRAGSAAAAAASNPSAHGSSAIPVIAVVAVLAVLTAAAFAALRRRRGQH